ncbi:Nitroreductase [Chitinispirillum alkaliphilum]|nr:Nitroreductase [Chitinispirillum alkaliphilum]
MKVTIFTLILLVASVQAQAENTIELNQPDMDRGLPLMQALAQRRSVRSWSEQKLGTQDLSDLLWAAFGVNRPDEGKRTAPTAMNVQDIDIYVFLEEGVYLYDAFVNTLEPVSDGDYRAEAGIQDFVATAPVTLLLVSDLSNYRGDDDAAKERYAAMHAGIISQNISIFCAGNEMGTVAIGMLDAEVLKERLNIGDNHRVLLSHPAGYLE